MIFLSRRTITFQFKWSTVSQLKQFLWCLFMNEESTIWSFWLAEQVNGDFIIPKNSSPVASLTMTMSSSLCCNPSSLLLSRLKCSSLLKTGQSEGRENKEIVDEKITYLYLYLIFRSIPNFLQADLPVEMVLSHNRKLLKL